MGAVERKASLQLASICCLAFIFEKTGWEMVTRFPKFRLLISQCYQNGNNICTAMFTAIRNKRKYQYYQTQIIWKTIKLWVELAIFESKIVLLLLHYSWRKWFDCICSHNYVQQSLTIQHAQNHITPNYSIYCVLDFVVSRTLQKTVNVEQFTKVAEMRYILYSSLNPGS